MRLKRNLAGRHTSVTEVTAPNDQPGMAPSLPRSNRLRAAEREPVVVPGRRIQQLKRLGNRKRTRKGQQLASPAERNRAHERQLRQR